MFGAESTKESRYPDTIDEESLIELDELNLNSNPMVTNKNRRKSLIPLSHQPKSVDPIKISDFDSINGDNVDSDDFDSFILNNFNPFSGSENVTDWLNDTDKKFNSHKISRNLRSLAVPLLVEGDAKTKYILNRNTIKSFDDLYEFLLINYAVVERNTRHVPLTLPSNPSNPINFTHNLLTHKNTSFEDQHQSTTHNFDSNDRLPPRPILRSTAIVDVGATKLTNDNSEHPSTFAPSSNIFHGISNLNQTTYVIHKAIIDNLIKSPKTFQGGKEDVKQWLEDIEQLFDTAAIPDHHKLHLIPYSLRGEARRWYKNTKATLTSWAIFVKELKEAFLSPFHEELAFKKLESYTQGINQPVRSFYNEVLKLCAETDTEMTESMKLRYLLKKAKPTLQYEIRKNKPTTTKQFLEYAKESEELLQLSNIDIDVDKLDYNTFNSTKSSINANPFPTYDPKTNSNNNYNNHNSNNKQSSDYNSRSHQPFNSSRSSNTYNASQRPNYLSHSNNQPGKSNQSFSSNTQRAPYNSRSVSSNNKHQPLYQHNTNSNRHNNQIPQVNSINLFPSPSSPQPTPLMSITDVCDQCQEMGHQASVCPRF